jgi:hypothetical protein
MCNWSTIDRKTTNNCSCTWAIVARFYNLTFHSQNLSKFKYLWYSRILSGTPSRAGYITVLLCFFWFFGQPSLRSITIKKKIHLTQVFFIWLKKIKHCKNYGHRKISCASGNRLVIPESLNTKSYIFPNLADTTNCSKNAFEVCLKRSFRDITLIFMHQWIWLSLKLLKIPWKISKILLTFNFF